MREYDYLHFPAEAVHVEPRVWLTLPPSARRVFEAVRDDGPLTTTALQQKTGMPGRTVRFAVRALKDAHLLDERCSLRDCRTCYFFVNQACLGVEDAPSVSSHRASVAPAPPA